MTAIVPKVDCGLGQFVLVAQCAQARSAQQEVPATRRVETEPADGEHPQEMPARKNQHVTFDRTHPAHDAVGPRANLARRLSSGTAVTEELPVRALCMDFSRSAAFILAIVPLDQVGIDLGRTAKPGQLAGSSRALQGTGEDSGKSQSAQPLAEGAGIAFAAFGQGQVGPAGMLPGEAPGGLTVPRQVYNRKNFAHTTRPLFSVPPKMACVFAMGYRHPRESGGPELPPWPEQGATASVFGSLDFRLRGNDE